MPEGVRYGNRYSSIDLPPMADVSIYCQSFFPFDRDAKFSTGMALPDIVSQNAGKCNVHLPTPSQAQAPPAWDLPSIFGSDPSLSKIDARQWFFDTRDSSLTGEGPQMFGWKDKQMPVAQQGGKKVKAKSGKHKKASVAAKRMTKTMKKSKHAKKQAATRRVKSKSKSKSGRKN